MQSPIGSDANKRYTDDLYDAASKSVIDAATESYSAAFFKAQPGNRLYGSIDDLKLTSYPAIGNVSFIPLGDSPLLGAASFTDGLLSSGFTQVGYVGAFAADDYWLDGWTEFDPQSAAY